MHYQNLMALLLGMCFWTACTPSGGGYMSMRNNRSTVATSPSTGDQSKQSQSSTAETSATQGQDKTTMSLPESPSASPETPTPSSAPAVYMAYGVSANGQIVRYSFQPTTGQLKEEKSFALAGKRPSFLSFSPQRKMIYVANEAGGSGGVMAYRVEPTGDLSFVNEVPSNGDGPTHVAVDRSGEWLMAAHYNSGRIHIYPLQSDGRIGPTRTQVFAGANAHQILSAPKGNRIVVPCLGSQYVAQYDLGADGSLTAATPPTLSLTEGSGPRHLAFHPNGNWAYLVNELNSTVQALAVQPTTQQLSLLGNAVSSLKAPVANNSGAEVQISADGRFVYTSNRGDQSIAQFQVGADGGLTLLNTFKTGGTTPRHFSIDPSGRWILAAQQDSGTITVLPIQQGGGALSPPVQTVNLPAVQFVEVFKVSP